MKRPFAPGRLVRGLAIGILLTLAGPFAPAYAQGQGGGSPVFQSWYPVGTPATLAVTGTTANVALPTGGLTLRACNTGAADIYVRLGTDNTVTASVANGTYIKAATCIPLNLVPFSTRYSWIAAISGTTSTFRAEAGLGSLGGN